MEKEGRGTVNNCAHTWTAYVASLARKCHDGSPFLISCCASKKTVGNAFLLHSDKNIQRFTLLKYYPSQESTTKFETITLDYFYYILFIEIYAFKIEYFSFLHFQSFFYYYLRNLEIYIINIIHMLFIYISMSTNYY